MLPNGSTHSAAHVVSFHEWDRESLVKYALAADEQLQQQTAEIEALRDELRVALNAWRALVSKTI